MVRQQKIVDSGVPELSLAQAEHRDGTAIAVDDLAALDDQDGIRCGVEQALQPDVAVAQAADLACATRGPGAADSEKKQGKNADQKRRHQAAQAEIEGHTEAFAKA
jgi:hypothetical protein